MAARWEWRTFGDDFGDAEDRLGALTPDRVGETNEVYLVSRTSDVSVKVRDETLDMKERIAVADDGLEQWQPVVKQPFPVQVPDAQRVFDALEADVRVVPVHKRRAHYLIDGCMAELTELTSAEARTSRSPTSVAVPSPPARTATITASPASASAQPASHHCPGRRRATSIP